MGADVDSTVWDLTAWVCKATFDVTGEQLNPEKITTWTRVLDFYGEEAATHIYELPSLRTVSANANLTLVRPKSSAVCGRGVSASRFKGTKTPGLVFCAILAEGVQEVRLNHAGYYED